MKDVVRPASMAALLLCALLTVTLAGAAQGQVIDGRYQDHGNGTVTDQQTGLTWMRCSIGQQWNGVSCSGGASRHSWDQAISIAQGLEHAGHNDWRLPTRDELNTIVYCSSGQRSGFNSNGYGGHCLGNFLKPTVLPAAFPNTPDTWYWSSSNYGTSNVNAWVMGSGDGALSGSYRSTPLRVRMVRGGQ